MGTLEKDSVIQAARRKLKDSEQQLTFNIRNRKNTCNMVRRILFVWISLLWGAGCMFAADWFTVTAVTAGAKVTIVNQGSGGEKPSLQCSTDGGATWTTFTAGSSSVTLSAVGSKAMFKGVNPNGFNREYNSGYRFSSTADIAVSGNIMTLIDGDSPGTTITAEACFALLFMNCDKLVSAQGLQMPATTVSPFCYYRMFYRCSRLADAPEVIGAKKLPNDACHDMFYQCKLLTEAPRMAADTVYDSGCENMFIGCTALTTVPDLPFKAIGTKGCSAMFSSCTALTTAPNMPSLISAGEMGCAYMFTGCTQMVSSPVLAAKTIGEAGYKEMFASCAALTSAPRMAAETVGKYGCYRMYSGCNKLSSSPDLTAQYVSTNAYQEMFASCAALTAAPRIEAIVIGISTCNKMFSSCTALVSAPAELPATAVSDSGCYAMFEKCTRLTAAPSMPNVRVVGLHGCRTMYSGCTSLTAGPAVLAAERIMDYGYAEMFTGCSKLTSVAGKLPAAIAGSYGYQRMFFNCAALTTAPSIAASTVGTYCMQAMFSGCKALTAPPARLPAKTLANYCYASMFSGCTALTTAPELPATTLANYCYNYMFSGCSKLTEAPVLPALSLKYNNNGATANHTGCYARMFQNCSSLTTIEVHFSEWGDGSGSNTDTQNKYPTNLWLDGVPAKGTFRAPCELADMRGTHNIPTGWTFSCMVRFTFDVRTAGASWDGTDTVRRILTAPLAEMPVAQKEGCLFTGWNTAPDGSGTALDLDNQPTTAQVYYPVFREADIQVTDWLDGACIVRTTMSGITTVRTLAEGGKKPVSGNLNDLLIDKPGVYAIRFDSGEADEATGQPLRITFYDSNGKTAGTFSVGLPVFVRQTTNASLIQNIENNDAVVLPGATLTFDSDIAIGDLYVSGGAKAVVAENTTLQAESVVLRAGRLGTDGAYTFCYPQMVALGAVSTPSSIIEYRYLISRQQYYALTLPYTVSLRDVTLLDGSPAEIVVQRYNGAARTSGQTGWETLWNPYTGSSTYPELEAATGYTCYAVPPQITMEGSAAAERRTWCYVSFPMKPNLYYGEKASYGSRTVSVTPHGMADGAVLPGVRPNDAAWNFAGNPYLADFGGLDGLTESGPIGLLQLQDEEYVWVGTQRYVVLPADDGRSFTPALASSAVLGAFRPFFVQTGKGDALVFPVTGRAQGMPSRAAALNTELPFGISLRGQGAEDRIAFLLGDNFTEAYDFNADLAKWENKGLNIWAPADGAALCAAALPYEALKQQVPVSVSTAEAGEYTFSIDESLTPDRSQLTRLYLYDKQTGQYADLMLGGYSCTLPEGSEEGRFFLTSEPQGIAAGEHSQYAAGAWSTAEYIEVFTTTGTCLYAGPPAGLRSDRLPEGTVLIRLQDGEGAAVKKVIIR